MAYEGDRMDEVWRAGATACTAGVMTLWMGAV